MKNIRIIKTIFKYIFVPLIKYYEYKERKKKIKNLQKKDPFIYK